MLGADLGDSRADRCRGSGPRRGWPVLGDLAVAVGANGLNLDIQAATAALTLPHHNGRTEGVNTRTILWNQFVKSTLVDGHPCMIEERCLDRGEALCPLEDLVGAGEGCLGQICC